MGEVTKLDDHRWRKLLITKSEKVKGEPDRERILAILANVVVILRYHEAWAGVLAWDAFGERIVTTRPPPWSKATAPHTAELGAWNETDIVRVAVWLSQNEDVNVSTKMIVEAVSVIAEAQVIHRVRDYLSGLRWDGVKRLDNFLAVYCGAAETAYTNAIGVRWLISAVARVMDPGCQVDCMLILESQGQGTGKSSAFRSLVPDAALYSETGINIGDKDSYQVLHGVWIYLLDELDSIRRGEITKTKNFISSPKDRYRASYARTPRDFKRQNVFCGTTNERDYLVDKTGNRRFWPVRVVHAIDLEAIGRDRDQIWAEAFARYESGEKWHVDTPELRALCEAEQAERVHEDPWDQVVAKWLDSPMCDVADRETGKTIRVPWRIPSDGVTTGEVLVHALGFRHDAVTKAQSMRCAEVLRSLGYTDVTRPREGGARIRRYAAPVQSAQLELAVGPEVGPMQVPDGTTGYPLVQPDPPVHTRA